MITDCISRGFFPPSKEENITLAQLTNLLYNSQVFYEQGRTAPIT